MNRRPIRVKNARQNNLKDVNVRVPVGAVTVITGVAGAGKSSLAFDVLYAEGHRQYVATFSPYARQFMERLERPDADRVEGVLPGISIGRTAPVKTSRSTVGTITSIDDYLRSLFARAATLYCRRCGRPVHRYTPSTIFKALIQAVQGKQALICFKRPVGKASQEVIRSALREAGFTRVLENGMPVRIEDARLTAEEGKITIIMDRIRIDSSRRQRLIDSIESALRFGGDQVEVDVEDRKEPLCFSTQLHCERCNIHYREPTPALFSFNHPMGACSKCNGFGRIIDIDPDLVIPNSDLSIEDGAVQPFQAPSHAISQVDMIEFAHDKGIPTDIPWRELSEEDRNLIWEGEGFWYGIRGFFEWLNRRRYKKGIRIFLSRYRQYVTCPVCGGKRLKDEVELFRIGGKTFPDIQQMAIHDCEHFIRKWSPERTDRATRLLLEEIRSRLKFLLDVGLSYVSLERRSRTLSGGETQRVTLATALGASLTSTLYVLDEPSVGLHSREKKLLANVLKRLADAGNAVMVVEHDLAFFEAADRIIELGPGPGQKGGNVVHEGTLAGLVRIRNSSTAAYLRGEIETPRPPKRRCPGNQVLRLRGATEHNLKDLTVDFPIGLLVCVTGVSGSGKSTLIDEVLYRNFRRERGLKAMEPGDCERIDGHEMLSGAVLVDQSPLTRSSRMNAATYLNILDPIRTAFAGTTQAKKRGLDRSAFSFNTKAGACPHCNGAGYEMIELQFLPDVYISCPGCGGKRYRSEVMEIRYRGYNIAEMLALPAEDVARVFEDHPIVQEAIQPLLEIGLGYLSLSQSAPTLSGGEAQRLKLARQLAETWRQDRMLLLLDEPTVGLHPSNVSDLLRVLQMLVDAGHSVVVIEHDINVLWSADWIIDLGPGGGDTGGYVVGQGPPEKIAGLNTATAHALRTGLPGPKTKRVSYTTPRAPDRYIRIVGAREHNLADIEVKVPRNRFVAITGISGSGKSTFAFDVLYAEGRQRFLDCLPTYARQYTRSLARPEVDRIEALPPSVAVEQKISRAGTMSTVGTVSEVYHYLRLLFSSIGVPYCPNCGVAGETAESSEITNRIVKQFGGEQIMIMAPLVRGRKGYHRDIIERAEKEGIKSVRVDGRIYDSSERPSLHRYRSHDIEAVIANRTVRPDDREAIRQEVERGLQVGSGSILVSRDTQGPDRFFSTRRACPVCGSGLPRADPRLFTWSQKFGACPRCHGSGMDPSGKKEHHPEPPPCRKCGGARLRPEALAVRIQGAHIGEVSERSIHEVREWLANVGAVRGEVEERILPELENRMRLLGRLGVGYLALNRSTETLATGEAQRVRIAAELASNLRGICYVLDEPTIGLHPRDIEALLQALFELRDRGNTVVTVEHEASVIHAADHVIDLGPGAGISGGQVVKTGSPNELMRSRKSVTGRWLRGEGQVAQWTRRPLADRNCLRILGAHLHNLKHVDVDFPIGRFTCVTGVSGSGKSTLVRDVMFHSLKAALNKEALPGILEGIQGVEKIESVKEVDESPIGRTPRSVPATYVSLMDELRQLFARLPEARARSYTASRFSFNVKGGRCESCKGQGQHKVEMPLLPVMYIPCDTCGGTRYNTETLQIRLKGRSIAEVLELTVDEALALLRGFPPAARSLQMLSDIGLGYLRLGQPSPTLSGGEAQRIKLTAEMAARSGGGGFYVFDEPTTGLHMADVAKLIAVLQRLVDRGDTVVVIEHDMDVIAAADYVIDLGPGSGRQGGEVVVQGTPEDVARFDGSWTGRYLRKYLKVHDRRVS